MEKHNNHDAETIHHNALVVDAHCDTLLSTMRDSFVRMEWGIERRSLKERSKKGHVDLPRLKEGGVNCQIFAAFIEPPFYPQSVERALKLIYTFNREISQDDSIKHVTTYKEIKEYNTEDKLSALLFFEGGEAINGGYIGREPDLRVLHMMYELGVRGITLTWNYRNKIADGVQEAEYGGGLTKYGRAVVAKMKELGMIVDVSHLSPSSFWDVLEVSTQPVIASHSDCRVLSNVARNLTDEQIKALAEVEGVIGINFSPRFLNKEKVNNGRHPTIKDVVDHIDHIVEVAGVEYVGLGSDFDGIKQTPKGLEDVSKLSKLTEELLNRGYTKSEIEKILGGNFLRVFKKVLQ